MGVQKTKLFLSISVLILGYQNCSQNRITIDEERKTTTLSQNKILTEEPQSDAKVARFTFVCPLTDSQEKTPKDLLHSEELKVVVEEYDYDHDKKHIVCEVFGVKKQILNHRSVDLSSCESIPDQQSANLKLYVVPEETKSGFDAHKINSDTTPLSLGSYALKYLHMNSGETSPVCDESGDPLVVQLPSSTDSVLNLTSPTDGVAFDLLGKRSYVNAHDKVLTSWFKSADSETYFLVKPNKDALVLGVDEMFSDTARGPDNKYAKHGFAALAKYDDNKDLFIDDNDVVFDELRLWKDSNLDGLVQESELFTLKDKKMIAIDLRYETQYREMDAYGNQSRYKSVVVMEDDSYGVILDLWLRFVHQPPSPAPESKPSEEKAAKENVVSEESPAIEEGEETSTNTSTPQPESVPSDSSQQTLEPHEVSDPQEGDLAPVSSAL